MKKISVIKLSCFIDSKRYEIFRAEREVEKILPFGSNVPKYRYTFQNGGFADNEINKVRIITPNAYSCWCTPEKEQEFLIEMKEIAREYAGQRIQRLRSKADRLEHFFVEGPKIKPREE